MRRSIIGFALLLVVAGCGSDPKADPSPSPSSAVTSPVSTTPSPPAMPDAAKENTKAGAIAFVRHYVSVQNYASFHGDTVPLRGLISSECVSCRSIAALIEKVYSAGGRIEGEGWTITRARNANVPGSRKDVSYVDVSLNIARQTIYASPGATPSSYGGNEHRLMTFGLTHEHGAWQVASIVAATS
jgi:hypothetical protein